MEYFLIKPDGETTGTFSIEQVRAMLNAGFIGPDTRYWHEGISDWQPIDRIEESLNFEPPPKEEARAIPSQRIAQVLKSVPPPSTKLERVKGPHSQPLPTPTRAENWSYNPPSVPASEGADHPDVEVYGPAEGLGAEPHAAPGPAARRTGLAKKISYVLLGAAIALAIDRGPSLVAAISDALATKVTLSGTDTFVLLDPATIKSFHQDIENSPTIDALQQQLAHTAEPMAQQRLRIGIDTERSRHTDEVRQQYLRSNSAQYIDAGTYRVLNSYDEDGNPTTMAKDQPAWVAVPYHGHTVYAFKAAENRATATSAR